MIEQLRSAGNQLRAAWDNYLQVYSNIQHYGIKNNLSHACDGFPIAFSNELDNELAFISSYESKIQQIKTAIHCARNYSSGVAPIASIPPEILTRIFHFARPEPCSLPRLTKYDHTYFPRYPDSLAHVCTLWRRITMSDCSLWCHIDLSLDESCYTGVISRAEAHVVRSGGQPVEFHLAVAKRWGTSLNYDRLSNLLLSISSRVTAIDLTALGGFPDFCRSVFRTILLDQCPLLTKLAVSSGTNHRNTFIFSDEEEPPVSHTGSGHFTLDLTDDEIENGFAPLTVLHLRGIFPVWSSAAYHGLVDLRLLSSKGHSGIAAAKLIAILEASPGLQILHFGIKFYSSLFAIEQASPVRLEDLRVVKIFPDGGESIGMRPNRVLRLLAPGPNPISLCLGGYHKPNATLLTDLEGFFARSRVDRFYTRGALPPISILLSQAVHNQCIIIDGLESGPHYELPPAWLQSDESGSLPRLGCMHITRSVLSEGDFRLLLDSCPDGITMHSCEVSVESSGGRIELGAQEFLERFPAVRITEYTIYPPKDPTADWDILP